MKLSIRVALLDEIIPEHSLLSYLLLFAGYPATTDSCCASYSDLLLDLELFLSSRGVFASIPGWAALSPGIVITAIDLILIRGSRCKGHLSSHFNTGIEHLQFALDLLEELNEALLLENAVCAHEIFTSILWVAVYDI